jgi:hypothetical protein
VGPTGIAQWIINVSYHCPVKGKGTHSHSSACSKQYIDNSVLGSNPANPVEHAQCCEEVTRNPAPQKTTSHDNPKGMFLGNLALVTLAVVLVEGIEEGTVDQNTWPDHTGRPDNKLTKKPTQAESNKLRSQGQAGFGNPWGWLGHRKNVV